MRFRLNVIVCITSHTGDIEGVLASRFFSFFVSHRFYEWDAWTVVGLVCWIQIRDLHWRVQWGDVHSCALRDKRAHSTF